MSSLICVTIVVLLASAYSVDSTEKQASVCSAGSSPLCKKHHHHHHHHAVPIYTNISAITEAMNEMNTAVLQVDNVLDVNMSLWFQSAECYKCDLKFGVALPAHCDFYIPMDTRWKTRLQITDAKDNILCNESDISHHFDEGGNYSLSFTSNISGIFCDGPILMNNPPNANLPIVAAFALFIILGLSWTLIKYLYAHHHLHRFIPPSCRSPGSYINPDLGLPSSINELDDENYGNTSGSKSRKKERLKSLDSFRGLSLVLMIFVNYGGGGYWFFKHSPWNGLTVADIVFPWFVFIMGTSMGLSFSSQMNRSVTRRRMFLKVIKRSAILFMLGLMINSGGKGVAVWNLRIPGVLQRLALTYLVVACIHIVIMTPHDVFLYNWFSIQDVTRFWVEWVIHIVIITIYVCLTFALRVPGCPRGYLGPGGWSDGGKHSTCTGGAASYIDHTVLGTSHLYHHSTCRKVYHTTTAYDPEGILGTLTSCFLCFLGLQAGKILLIYRYWVARVARWFIWGLMLCLIATILCKASKEEGWIPINKNLWSLSFVMLLGGFAFIVLAVFYIAIDVKKVWSGSPFTYPGMNPIVLYVCHEVFHRFFPVYLGGYANHHWELVSLNIYGTALWMIVSYVMYRNDIFISI